MYRRKDNLVLHMRRHKIHVNKAVIIVDSKPGDCQSMAPKCPAPPAEHKHYGEVLNNATNEIDPSVEMRDQQPEHQLTSEQQLFRELEDFLNSQEPEPEPEPTINIWDGLAIPENIGKIAMAHTTPYDREECAKLVNTHKLLIYACYKLYHVVDKRKTTQ